jgi:ApaG protein
MYIATTRDISVIVHPRYLPEQSDPAKSQYVWAYQVRIENKGAVAVQLRSRHWKITDGLGRRQEVKGRGVVGETPRLEPGQAFEYTSGTPLSTPSGFMGGTYQMVSDGGESFDIEIPTFSLDTPAGTRQLN